MTSEDDMMVEVEFPKLWKETIYQGISGGRDDQVTEYIS